MRADLHERAGGPGVGAVGMCFTGGFALGMMVDERMLAPVLSQPSLPFPVGAKRKRDLGICDTDLAAVKERTKAGACVLGLCAACSEKRCVCIFRRRSPGLLLTARASSSVMTSGGEIFTVPPPKPTGLNISTPFSMAAFSAGTQSCSTLEWAVVRMPAVA